MSTIAPVGSLNVQSLTTGNGNDLFVPIVCQVPTARPFRLTVEQVELAIRAGVLTENDRCELIRGELIQKMTIGDPHMAAVKRLNRWFSRRNDDRYLVGVQDAIKLADSRPEPDITLLVPEADCYEFRTPTPPDILLVIEVADSTLAFDRRVKGPLYAENGIGEYWIVNLVDQCIEIHRLPSPDGRYLQTTIARRGEELRPLKLADSVLPVDLVLGPVQPGVSGPA